MPVFLIPAAVAAAPTLAAAAAAIAATTGEILAFIACGAAGGGLLTFGIFKGVSWNQERLHRESLARQQALYMQRSTGFIDSSNNLQSRIGELTIELETLNVASDSAQENCIRLQGIIDVLRTEATARRDEIQRLNDEARAHQSLITNAVNETSASFEELINKNTALVQQLTALVTQLGEKSEIINQLTTELAAANARIAGLEQSNKSLNSVVTEQNQLIDTQNEIIDNQAEDIDTLRVSASSLASQVSFFRELSGHSSDQGSTIENTPRL